MCWYVLRFKPVSLLCLVLGSHSWFFVCIGVYPGYMLESGSKSCLMMTRQRSCRLESALKQQIAQSQHLEYGHVHR
eukprot:1968797-Amphidinium_carterae.1